MVELMPEVEQMLANAASGRAHDDSDVVRHDPLTLVVIVELDGGGSGSRHAELVIESNISRVDEFAIGVSPEKRERSFLEVQGQAKNRWRARSASGRPRELRDNPSTAWLRVVDIEYTNLDTRLRDFGLDQGGGWLLRWLDVQFLKTSLLTYMLDTRPLVELGVIVYKLMRHMLTHRLETNKEVGEVHFLIHG